MCVASDDFIYLFIIIFFDNDFIYLFVFGKRLTRYDLYVFI